MTTMTRTPSGVFHVGDLVKVVAGPTNTLVDFYRGQIGTLTEISSDTLLRVRFAEKYPHHVRDHIADWDAYWYSQVEHAPIEVGDKVRVVAALVGATEEFKSLAAGRTATVLEVARPSDGCPRVRFDDPFYLDGHTWSESAVQSVAPIEREGTQESQTPASLAVNPSRHTVRIERTDRDAATTDGVKVGDKVRCEHIEPRALAATYNGMTAEVVLRDGDGGMKVRFPVRESGSDEWYLMAWTPLPNPGQKVTVTAALPGASSRFAEWVKGREAVYVESSHANHYVRFTDDVPGDMNVVRERCAVAALSWGEAVEVKPAVTTPVDAEGLRQQIRDLEHRHDRLQDVLAEQAEERDWCSEFEDFCERNDLESRREQEHDYDITVDLTYTKTVDEMVDYIEGTSCPSDSTTVRFTYRVTFTWRGREYDLDDADFGDLLSEQGYSEWSDYDVVSTDRC